MTLTVYGVHGNWVGPEGQIGPNNDHACQTFNGRNLQEGQRSKVKGQSGMPVELLPMLLVSECEFKKNGAQAKGGVLACTLFNEFGSWGIFWGNGPLVGPIRPCYVLGS